MHLAKRSEPLASTTSGCYWVGKAHVNGFVDLPQRAALGSTVAERDDEIKLGIATHVQGL